MKWAKPHFLHPAWWSEPSGPPAPLFTHLEWAKQQVALAPKTIEPPLTTTTWYNQKYRHCRIGKVTLKKQK